MTPRKPAQQAHTFVFFRILRAFCQNRVPSSIYSLLVTNKRPLSRVNTPDWSHINPPLRKSPRRPFSDDRPLHSDLTVTSSLTHLNPRISRRPILHLRSFVAAESLLAVVSLGPSVWCGRVYAVRCDGRRSRSGRLRRRQPLRPRRISRRHLAHAPLNAGLYRIPVRCPKRHRNAEGVYSLRKRPQMMRMT